MKVSVKANFLLASVGAGLVASVAVFSLTDVLGTGHTAQVGSPSWPSARNPDGSMDIKVDFDDLPAGTFTGSVQMTDSTGNPVGDAKSFAAPSDNPQFVANGVTVTVS